ncbi:MAG: radical SAM protein [Planctomycetota bacterium]|nr:radical SAM protein [Planctomycetota bacterium]
MKRIPALTQCVDDSQFEPGLMTEIMRRAASRYHLLSVLVELTRKCNLRCIHCYASRSPGRPELGDSALTALLRELRALGVLHLTISGGEPTLRPAFRNVVESAAAAQFSVSILSNGTALDKARCRWLVACPQLAKVAVSLYGATSRTHDAITRARGSFRRTVAGVERLAGLGKEVLLKFLIMRPNLREAEGMFDLAHRLRLPLQIDTVMTARDNGDRAPVRLRVGDEDQRRIFRLVRAEQLSRGEVGSGIRNPESGTQQPGSAILRPETRVQNPEAGNRKPHSAIQNQNSKIQNRKPASRNLKSEIVSDGGPLCSAGVSYCSINAYGDCYACPQTPVSQGNVLERPLADIWRHGRLLNRLRRLRFSQLTGCRSCRITAYCRLCPGLALMEEGDIRARSETCCRQAELWREVCEEPSAGRPWAEGSRQ